MTPPTQALAAPAWPACLSALALDRLLVGELPASEEESVRAHLAGCARCAEALASLRADRDGARLPSLRVVPLPLAVARRPSPPAWRRLAVGASAFAAAAAFALWLVPPSQRERLKGTGLGLSMFVQASQGTEVRRVGPGELVQAGAAVRFAVTSPGKAWVAVLSVDPLGKGSVYFPAGARAEPVAGGVEVPLPLATRLDATGGEERLLGLFCSSAIELEPVRARLESKDPILPSDCQVIQWSFVKR